MPVYGPSLVVARIKLRIIREDRHASNIDVLCDASALCAHCDTRIPSNPKDRDAQAQPMSEYVMNILASGGIKSVIKQQLESPK